MLQEVLEISFRSLILSLTATVLSLLWSIPVTLALISHKSKISESISSIINSLVGFPTVLIGLALYLIFSNQGPLGFLRLLYSPQAIIVGQSILITPLAISILKRTLETTYENCWELTLALGGTEKDAFKLIVTEATSEMLSSIIICFSRAIGELGVALMVGGNIKGYTRVLTTSIALEISKGEFELAILLGFILLVISVTLSLILRILRWIYLD